MPVTWWGRREDESFPFPARTPRRDASFRGWSQQSSLSTWSRDRWRDPVPSLPRGGAREGGLPRSRAERGTERWPRVRCSRRPSARP